MSSKTGYCSPLSASHWLNGSLAGMVSKKAFREGGVAEADATSITTVKMTMRLSLLHLFSLWERYRLLATCIRFYFFFFDFTGPVPG
jgi:hypothetical protein